MNDLMDMELSLEEIDDISSVNYTLFELLENISLEGVSRNDMSVVNNLLDLEENVNYPLRSFTVDKSFINFDVAQESILNSMISGFRRMMELILKAIGNFFNKLAEVIKSVADKFSKKGKDREEVKTTLVIEALQKDKEVATKDGKRFQNKINDKKVSGVYTEKLLQMSHKDNSGNKYKSIKEVMQIFFGKELTDEKWKNYIAGNDTKLKTLSDYVTTWWNLTHPIVSTDGNLSKEFVVKIVDLINLVVEQIVYRLNWWLNRIEDLTATKPENLDRLVTALSKEKNVEFNKVNSVIKQRMIDAFRPIKFINVNIGNDLLLSAKNTFDSFKVAKVTPASKIDFIQSLDAFEWVSGLDDLDEKIKRGKKYIKDSERESKKIISDIRKGILKDNRTLMNKIGVFMKEMKAENQNFIFLAAILLSFVTFIESKITDNRKKSADIHILMVSVGIKLEKEEF